MSRAFPFSETFENLADYGGHLTRMNLRARRKNIAKLLYEATYALRALAEGDLDRMVVIAQVELAVNTLSHMIYVVPEREYLYGVLDALATRPASDGLEEVT
jgi:hypothetical protein